MNNEYRIVADRWLGFETQIRRWWFPIWMQVGWTNTHRTEEGAELFARRHASPKINYLGRLP